MSQITVSAENVPFVKFKGITAGAGALRLRIYCNLAFITGGTQSGKLVPAGAPGTDAFYIDLPVTVTSMTWNSIANVLVAQLPSFVIDSTIDGQNTKSARYSAFFYSPTGKQLGAFSPFENFAVPDVTDTGALATWTQLLQFNVGIARIPPATYAYDAATIDRKLAAINAVSIPSGLTTGDLVTGSGAGMFARFPAHGIAAPRYLKETGTTLSWGTIDPTDITTGLGYTPVNKVGDSMSGNLQFTGIAKPILAVQPTDGSLDLDVASVFYVKSKVTGMGAGNVVSINADTTAAQTLVTDTVTNLFPNLVITDPGAGVHRFGFTGQLAVSRGGTNIPSYATGDQLYASSSSVLSKLAVGTANQVMIVSGGLPAWGQVSLTAGVTGILPSDKGGTGSAFFAIAGPTSLRTYTFPDTSATLLTTANVIIATQGGTGFPSYTVGDTLYADTPSTFAKVAGNITVTRKFYRQAGNGTTAGAPIWDVVWATDIQTSVGGPLTLPQGGTGAAALGAGYIKSDATVLSSQAIPIPIGDGGTNATAFGNPNGLVIYDTTKLVTFATGGIGTVLGGGSTPTWTATPQANTLQLNSLVATGVVFLDSSKITAVDAVNFFWDNTGKVLNLRQGGLKILNTAGDNAFTLKANGSAGTARTYIWPSSFPIGANYSLVSDTSGNLSWVNISGGGGGGAITINGDSGPAYVFTPTTTGSDFTVSTPGAGIINLNLPTASQTARGLVSTGTQVFGGVKTFLDEVNFTTAKTVTFGAGSILAPSLIIPVGSALLSSAQSGAIENDGTRPYYTNALMARKSIAFLDSSITGTAGSFTGNLTGDVTSVGMATSYAGILPLTKGGTGFNIASIGTEGQFLGVTSSAVAFRSDASQLTNLNATQLTTGFVPAAVLAGVIVNASVSAVAAIAWSKLDKTGSSLLDLSTRSAADLSSGTLPDGRLSANVVMVAMIGAASGVASLNAGSKVPNAQISEVLSVTDLTSYITTSGTGTQALLTTITAPTSGQVIMWDGTNWVNQGMPAAGVHNMLSTTHPDTNSAATAVAQGDLMYGSDITTSKWDRLPIGSAARVLVSTSGTFGVVPAWSQVNLASMVTGTLPFSNGGLGFTSGTSGGLVYLSAAAVIASSGAMTANGAMYGQGSGLPPTTVALNTTATPKYLYQVSSAAPIWQQISGADLSTFVLNKQSGSSIASTTSEVDLITYTIPANTLGTTDGLRIRAQIRFINTTGGAVVFIWRYKLAGGTWHRQSVNYGSGADIVFEAIWDVGNVGSLSVNRSVLFTSIGANTTAATTAGADNMNGAAPSNSNAAPNVNFGADVILAVSIQMSVSSASASCQMMNWSVMQIK